MNNFPSNILFKTSMIANGNMSFRFGESDEVVGNRRRFLSENAADYRETVCMACNHGETITPIDWSIDKKYFGAEQQEDQIISEVLVTKEKNLALMLLTADCLPTAFYDPIQKVIALAHLNRKTIAHDLGQKTVGFLSKHFGTDPNDLLIHIGPHIKKESYHFLLPLIEPAPSQLTEHMHEKDEEVYIDLPAAEVAQLIAVGVQAKNISVSSIDTYTSSDHFSHYRSQRDAKHPAGRLATILVMR